MKKMMTTLMISILTVGSIASASTERETEDLKNEIVALACSQNRNKLNKISYACDQLEKKTELFIVSLATTTQVRQLLEKANPGSIVDVSCIASTLTRLTCDVAMSEGDDLGRKLTSFVQPVDRQSNGDIFLVGRSVEKVQYID